MVLVSVFFLLPATEQGETLEYAWLDFMYTARGAGNAPENVVVVAIDEPSFKEIGLRWPWPRSYHGTLIEKINALGARAVAFDIAFVEASPDREDDLALARAVKEAGNVILGSHISQVTRHQYQYAMIVHPLDILARAAKRVAILTLVPDSDGIIRHGMRRLEGSFSLAHSAAAISGLMPQGEKEDSDSFLIDFAGPSGTVTTVSYYQVLSGSLPPVFFRDKVVLVGLSSDAAVEIEGAVDAFPTPFFRFSRKMMYGVEIHANAVATLLSGTPLRSLEGPFIPLIFLALSFTPFLTRKYPLLHALITLCLLLSMGLCSALLFIYGGLVTAPVPGMAATLTLGLILGISEYRKSDRQKRFIKDAFSTYLAPSVVNQLLKSPEKLVLGGEKREITAFFSDVEGFTSISEKLTPVQLVELLNEFLTEMTDIILAHEGTVDKFEGDAIIAFFGAPNPLANHAEIACRASFEMQKRLAEMRKTWAKQGKPLLKMRIGLCTGAAVVGNMGSKNRMDYTMMGDTVNIAARLEGVNKVYGCYTLINESTEKEAGNGIFCRELDRIFVVGRKESVSIHEVLGYTNDIGEKLFNMVELYEQGLNAYRLRKWKDAQRLFGNALEIMPDDGPSRVMMERCREYFENPPGEEWTGFQTRKYR